MTIKTSRFDVEDYLVDEELMGYFLTDCLEEGGVPLFLDAIGEVARARGMSDLAASSGLTRTSLYKALNEGGNPTVKTVVQVLDGLGFRVTIVPKEHKTRAAGIAKKPARDPGSVVQSRLAQDRVSYAARAPSPRKRASKPASRKAR